MWWLVPFWKDGGGGGVCYHDWLIKSKIASWLLTKKHHHFIVVHRKSEFKMDWWAWICSWFNKYEVKTNQSIDKVAIGCRSLFWFVFDKIKRVCCLVKSSGGLVSWSVEAARWWNNWNYWMNECVLNDGWLLPPGFRPYGCFGLSERRPIHTRQRWTSPRAMDPQESFPPRSSVGIERTRWD